MKAAVCRAFGEPLTIEEVRLAAPRAGEIEVEVKASRKGDKGKVVFEIEWSDEARGLEIVS